MTKTYEMEIIHPEFTTFSGKPPERREVLYEVYKKCKGNIVKVEVKVISN